MEDLTQRKVSFASVGLSPTFKLQIKSLEIHGLTKIDYLFISPSILGLLSGNLAFNEIKMIGPEFTYERLSEYIGSSAKSDFSVVETAKKAKKKVFPKLIIKRLRISKGKLNYIDRKVRKDGLIIEVNDLYFSLDSLVFLPKSVITNFKLKGKIPWKEAEQQGEISLSGWINLFKKDMQAKFEVKDIDGVYLHPYYANWVDLEKSRIQQANLQLKSEISGHNNDIVANCHLELTDIVFRPAEAGEEEGRAYKIATAVLDIFKALDKEAISLDFTIRTKMDSPYFGYESIRSAFESKLAKGIKLGKINPQDLVSLPVNLINDTVEGATNITTALIDGIVQLGSFITDSFKAEEAYN